MVTLHSGMYKYENGAFVPAQSAEGKDRTMAHAILSAHNTSGCDADLKIKFDAMASHDITYVGIIQTARASGMKKHETERCEASAGPSVLEAFKRSNDKSV